MQGRESQALLLLRCLNGPDPKTVVGLERLGLEEWRTLVRAAARHGLRELLYARLAGGLDSMRAPETVLRELREHYLKNGTRNMLLYRDLARGLRALRAERIPVIVLKGAHLAALVYAEPAVRPMGDIDLLVPGTDLAKAAAVLEGLGYAMPECGDLEMWRKNAVAQAHLPSFFKPPHPRIELHWRMDAAQPAAEETALWKRARPARIAEVDTLVLSPEDLILHLCLHEGSHHLFELGLRPLFDLRAALERDAEIMNWELLVSRTREWNVEKCLYLVLRLARELVGAPVPEPVLHSLKPAGFKERWLTAAKERLFITGGKLDEQLAGTLSRLSALLNFFNTNPLAVGHRSRWRAILPSRAYMTHYMSTKHALPLTPVRRWTCYFTRGLDWIGKTIRLTGFLAVHYRQVPNHLRDQYNQWLLQK